MATTTPKLDRIIDQFTALIGYPAEYTADVLQASDVLTKAQVESYISKAMFKLFNQYWVQAAQGAKTPVEAAQKFLIIFPELFRQAAITVTTGVYTIATPNFDIFHLYGCSETSGDAFVRVLDVSMNTIVKSETFTQYTASATRMIAIYQSNTIHLYPEENKFIDIDFIKKPVIPTTGGILEQNGAEATPDSPFSEHWEPVIADMADKIYRQERQIGRN